MSLTNYGEVELLNAFKGLHTYYLGVLTAAPSESSSGTEASGGSYARIPVTFNTPVSGDPSYIVNSDLLEFPTATLSWGTVVAWGLYDAATGGNLIWYGTLSVAKEITQNDTLIIHNEEFKLTLD